jgi:hypothetical protein
VDVFNIEGVNLNVKDNSRLFVTRISTKYREAMWQKSILQIKLTGEVRIV